jgi:acetylornithine deacetylase/succinyl-diaminopimelate desuccinylase-like protein
MFEDAMIFAFAQEEKQNFFTQDRKALTAKQRKVREDVGSAPFFATFATPLRFFAVKIFPLHAYFVKRLVNSIFHQESHLKLSLISLCAALVITIPAQGQIDEPTRQLSHDIFKQLIEINTTDSVGNVSTAAEAMAQRFRDAGFSNADIYLGGPNDRKKNLVVRLHGSAQHKPVLLLGHLDVVEARREDWTTDPFQFVEKDGFFYGRGTQDMKDGDAIMVTTLIRFKKDNFVPDRDIILALTADEEGGKFNGVEWLLKNHRDLIDAEFVMNTDDITLWTKDSKPEVMEVDASEKIYSDYQFVVTDPGGHSSLPKPQNPIYELSAALVRLQNYTFPAELSDVTRAYYERTSQVEAGQRAADIKAILKSTADHSTEARLSQNINDNAILHTTCVATRVEAGHANNALPQRAEAIVNCRILPGHTKQEVRETLARVVADPAVAVRYVGNDREVTDTVPSVPVFTPYRLRKDVLDAVEKITGQMWPDTPVIPTMARGASDGIFTSAAGMPTYIVAGIAVDRNDDREHGRDERVGVKSFYDGLDFWDRFLRTLTSQGSQH